MHLKLIKYKTLYLLIYYIISCQIGINNKKISFYADYQLKTFHSDKIVLPKLSFNFVYKFSRKSRRLKR